MSDRSPEFLALRPRHQRLVAEYLVDLSAPKAYVRAGYCSTNPEVNAYRTFHLPQVAAAVRVELAKLVDAANLTPGKILRDLEETRLRALGEGKYHAAIRASELQARYANAFPGHDQLDPPVPNDEFENIPMRELARRMLFGLSLAIRQPATPASAEPTKH